MFLLPKLENLTQTEKTIRSFKGLNASDTIEDGEFADCANLFTGALPVLSVCNPLQPKTAFGTTAEPSDLLCLSSRLYEIYANNPLRIVMRKPQSDGTEQMAAIALQPAQQLLCIAEFEGDPVLFTFLSGRYELTRYSSDGSVAQNVELTALFETSGPHIADVVSYQNRLIILQDEYVHIGYAGALDRWDEYFSSDMQVSLKNAMMLSVRAEGKFVGGYNFKNEPVFFTENAIYQLIIVNDFFDLKKVANIGCSNKRSIAVCGDLLFFLTQNGVMTFDGNKFKNISRKCPNLEVLLKDATGCADGRYYYLGNYYYDTEEKVWGKIRAAAAFDSRCFYNNGVYYMHTQPTPQGYACTSYRYTPNIFDSDAAPQEWYFVTGEFHEYNEDKKNVVKLAFRVEPHQNAEITVYLSQDGGGWSELLSKSVAADAAQKILLKVPPCESFRIKICGKGKVTIPYLKYYYRPIWNRKVHPFYE